MLLLRWLIGCEAKGDEGGDEKDLDALLVMIGPSTISTSDVTAGLAGGRTTFVCPLEDALFVRAVARGLWLAV